jgi:hypothetical protein
MSALDALARSLVCPFWDSEIANAPRSQSDDELTESCIPASPQNDSASQPGSCAGLRNAIELRAQPG